MPSISQCFHEVWVHDACDLLVVGFLFSCVTCVRGHRFTISIQTIQTKLDWAGVTVECRYTRDVRSYRTNPLPCVRPTVPSMAPSHACSYGQTERGWPQPILGRANLWNNTGQDESSEGHQLMLVSKKVCWMDPLLHAKEFFGGCCVGLLVFVGFCVQIMVMVLRPWLQKKTDHGKNTNGTKL